MNIPLLRKITLLAFSFLSTTLLLAQANCSAPNWSTSTTYTGGEEVLYQSKSFKAKNWILGQAPDETDSWGPWKFLGNCTTQSTTPTALFNGLINNQTLTIAANETVLIQVAATDTDGTITDVSLTVENQAYSLTLNGNYYEYSWTPSGYGIFTIETFATDNANLVSTTVTKQIEIKEA